MQRLFRFLNQEIRGLHHTAFLLAFASVGAKVLAIFRDRFLASIFGAGKTLDIYYASFRLPDLLYVFSLFLVSVTALIPFFLEKKKISFEASRSFINSVFTAFFALMLLLVLISFFAAPYITDIIAPGFSPEDKGTLIMFTRILLLSPLLLGFSNLVSSVIQSFRRFLAYALSGVFYNAGIILGLLVLYPRFGMSGIVWGVVFGACLHFLIQTPSLISLGYFPKFTTNLQLAEIKKLAILSFPRTLGLTLNQVVLTVITAIASFLAVGSIAVFNLALNLQTIPLGIIALSYSVAAFPSLANNFIKKEKEKFLFSVVLSFRHILFWLLPFAVLFIVLRAQIVRVVLGAGAFTWTDTRLTAAALALFSTSLFAQGLILLLVRAFYAAGKTKIPLVINIISSFVVVFFSLTFLFCFKNFPETALFFEKILRVEGVAGVSMLALPLAYSLGTVLNFFLLFLFFEKSFGSISKYVEKNLWQTSLTSAVVGIVAYIFLNIFDSIFDISTFLGIFMQGFFSGVFAIIVGFVLLKFLKNEELKEIIFSLKERFSKKTVTAVEPEEIL